MMPMHDKLDSAALVFFFMGLLNGFGAYAYYWLNQKCYASWVKTAGTVVEMVTPERYMEVSDYLLRAPRVRFRTEAGREIIFQDAVWSMPARYSEGEIVELLYDPRNPEAAILPRFRRATVWLVAVMGGVFCAIGIGLYLSPRF